MIALTLDIDWAPDFVIDTVAARLVDRGVRATWFVTHSSPAVDRLRLYPELFELGIHPNFLPGSTHGDTPEAVLDYCLSLVPGATSVRTHALAQSTILMDMLSRRGLQTDLSIFLPRNPYLHPVESWFPGRMLLRVPYNWADDFEMNHPTPIWHLQSLIEACSSPVFASPHLIFDFHPIHIFLNSANLEPYQNLKQAVPRLAEASPDEVQPFVQQGEGTDTMFSELIDYLAEQGGGLRVQDIQAQYAIEVTE